MICFCLIVYCRGEYFELERDIKQNTKTMVNAGPRSARWVPINSTAMLRCYSRQEHLRIYEYKIVNTAATRCLPTGAWSIDHFDCFKGKWTVIQVKNG